MQSSGSSSPAIEVAVRMGGCPKCFSQCFLIAAPTVRHAGVRTRFSSGERLGLLLVSAIALKHLLFNWPDQFNEVSIRIADDC